MLMIGCTVALVAGVIAGRAIPGLLAAVAAGAGGILLVIFVIFPNCEWTLAMKIAFPLCGAAGAVTRLLWTRSSPESQRRDA